MNKLRKKSTEEMHNYINQMGLENLDENDKNLIITMLTNSFMNIFQKGSRNSFSPSEFLSSSIKVGIYTQNYLLLKQLNQINESNKTIVEQNEKIIELLTKMSEK